MTITGKNWFDQGGTAYATFRPEYPPQVASYLAGLVPDTRLAVDVGCGTGQLTRLLTPFFDTVIGCDPSVEQIANCDQTPSIRYQCARAEALPCAEKSVSLITAAQAAHWFDLPAFYAEVKRIGIDRGVLALISYGVLTLEPLLNDRFRHFYWNEIGAFWPPERKLVDDGYATIDFPFAEQIAPSMEIRREWALAEFLGYISTWSAVRHAKEVGREDVLQSFAADIAKAWGEPGAKRSIVWPINMRIGRL